MRRLAAWLLLWALWLCSYWSTVVCATEFYVNPDGTDARVFNKLILEGSTTRACLNLTLLAETPSDPETGDLWCVDSGSTHQCCYQTDNGRYCWTATLTP